MGDMTRCPHGDMNGYCEQCNMACPQCKNDEDLRDDCRKCAGIGTVRRPIPQKPWDDAQ